MIWMIFEASHHLLNVLWTKNIHIVMFDLLEWGHSAESYTATAVENCHYFVWIESGILLT